MSSWFKTRYLSYMIYEVPFPTYQKPRVQVYLTDNEDDYMTINFPNDTYLPNSYYLPYLY